VHHRAEVLRAVNGADDLSRWFFAYVLIGIGTGIGNIAIG